MKTPIHPFLPERWTGVLWLALHSKAAKHTLTALLLAGAGSISQAAELTTVSPKDTGATLVNPDMGWTMHFYSNIPDNYGSKLEPADTLEDFPGLSTVYLRVPCAFLEPEEGRFSRALLDTPAQR